MWSEGFVQLPQQTDPPNAQCTEDHIPNSTQKQRYIFGRSFEKCGQRAGTGKHPWKNGNKALSILLRASTVLNIEAILHPVRTRTQDLMAHNLLIQWFQIWVKQSIVAQQAHLSKTRFLFPGFVSTLVCSAPRFVWKVADMLRWRLFVVWSTVILTCKRGITIFQTRTRSLCSNNTKKGAMLLMMTMMMTQFCSKNMNSQVSSHFRKRYSNSYCLSTIHLDAETLPLPDGCDPVASWEIRCIAECCKIILDYIQSYTDIGTWPSHHVGVKSHSIMLWANRTAWYIFDCVGYSFILDLLRNRCDSSCVVRVHLRGTAGLSESVFQIEWNKCCDLRKKNRRLGLIYGDWKCAAAMYGRNTDTLNAIAHEQKNLRCQANWAHAVVPYDMLWAYHDTRNLHVGDMLTTDCEIAQEQTLRRKAGVVTVLKYATMKVWKSK